MNFGAGDFVQLKRKDGAVLTVELTGLEGHSISISIGRRGNRTQLDIELRADMSVVRYQAAPKLEAPKLTEGQSALPPGVLELPEGKP